MKLSQDSYNKLKAMCKNWDDDTLSFIPTCPRELYDLQLHSMKEHLAVIVTRAKIEGVDLN